MKSRNASVWITCGECGHTTRALSVMAKRVLEERANCPGCKSTGAPILIPTLSGANIAHNLPQGASLEELKTPGGYSNVSQEVQDGSWMRRVIRQFAPLSSQRMHR